LPIGWSPAKRNRRAIRAAQHGAGNDGPLDPLTRLLQIGLPVAPAAAPRDGSCSCDRIGCPMPASHPLSRAWQSEASADPEQLARWQLRHPGANYVSPTGGTHDVLDVPADAGEQALRAILVAGTGIGPVAESDGRYLFFTAPRTDPDAAGSGDADEWWSSDLDCRPETVAEHPGLRWHDRGSYVLVPPSVSRSGDTARWVYWPVDGTPLPDALLVLGFLADVLAEVPAEAA
jgi:hypothetical protein